MSTEQNKAVARQFVEEVIGRGNNSLVDELVAPDFVDHQEFLGMPPGREGLKQVNKIMRSAFPDTSATIEDMVAEGDKVVIRWTMRATHKGEFMGMPPTGKSISVGVINIQRFAGGKIVEHWGLTDSMAMMQQLGAMPAPGQGGH
jgi:steroid delta-isomerase-like uncharacterized protein